jgi:acetyl esterase/lipase
MAAHHGIAGLCISYRLTTRAPYPACVQDARAAVRWLRSRAGEYGIDPDRIGIGGSSAGAHIAAMVATNADLAADREAAAAGPCRVQAAALFNGVYRLPVDPPDSLTVESTTLLLGGRPDEVPDRYRAASPVNFVSPPCPPTLLLHGSADRCISHRQSLKFAERLKAAGVPAEVEIFEGADHGTLNDPANIHRSLDSMVRFFKRFL